ncbi:hypothetical protein ASU79_21465 [Klebsiella aerogenes]|nr:hypothetical protein YA16_16940 [Klebsiella aerogenes]KTJ65980.1 hypothetical protein ASU79_21465 [Klebsiella aerogenes]KZQ72257.1 hypothetical protein A3N50_23670 [Klebsiella aerogenes]
MENASGIFNTPNAGFLVRHGPCKILVKQIVKLTKIYPQMCRTVRAKRKIDISAERFFQTPKGASKGHK